jgi:hypothetical protein
MAMITAMSINVTVTTASPSSIKPSNRT